MAVKDEYKDLPLVPESVLKRRHDLDDLRRKRQAENETAENKKKRKKRRQGDNDGASLGRRYVIKPATFVAKAKQRRNEQIRCRRVKKKGMQKRASKKPETKTKEIMVEQENDDDDEKATTIRYRSNSVGCPYVFAIRIREDAGRPPKCVRNILVQLRLKRPNTGVFVRYDATTKKHLHLVEPWVVYGTPSDGIVGDLMKRRSFGKTKDSKVVPLSDNTVIEQALGDSHGLICMEDMVHELIHAGENFDAVSKFLVPFPLTSDKSKFEKKLLSANSQFGREHYGDKGEEIDEFIKLML